MNPKTFLIPAVANEISPRTSREPAESAQETTGTSRPQYWLALSIAMFLVLSGSAIAEGMSHEPAKTRGVRDGSFSLSVMDEREIVLSGEKGPSFIGMTIDTGGNAIEYHTEDKAPLTDHIKRDLLRDLRSLGYEEQTSSDSTLITVNIRDWNLDASQDVNFQYELVISVTSPNGNVLAKSIVKGKNKLGSISNEPNAYNEIIKALVRENKDVTAALNNSKYSTGMESNSISADNYVGIYKGTVQFADAQVTVVDQTPSPCILGCTPVSASQDIHFEKGNTAGFRIGTWREYFGLAAELGVTHGVNAWTYNGSSVSFGYYYLSIIPMLRMPLFKTDSIKGGRLNLYAGLGFVGVLGGNIDIVIPPNIRVSEKAKDSTGTIALMGASYRFQQVMLFVEWRTTDSDLKSDSWGITTNVPISTKETVAGVAYRF